jgi:ribonucleoside-diphosphate reductase alpha chain
MVKYEDVKNQTTEEYFNGNQFSIDAFNKKYCAFEGETYVQALKRVCDYMASCEATQELQQYWSERWFDEVYNDWWHPAGSIMQGAGVGRKISMANCTTISLGLLKDDEEWDSLESIVKNTAYTVAKTAAYRQGLGVDFSRLRPRDTKVLNSSNISSGAIHWMKFIDSIGYYVGQKGRIPAMLFSISCSHPDVIEFIKAKADYTVVQNANISVQCTNAFYDAVNANADWDLTFEIPEVKKGQRVYIDHHSADLGSIYDPKPNRYYYIARQDRPYEKMVKTVKAKEVLELIAKHMFLNAEPGIQNIDIARKYSNSDYLYSPLNQYDSRIISTNACSEQYLSRESLCVSSFN